MGMAKFETTSRWGHCSVNLEGNDVPLADLIPPSTIVVHRRYVSVWGQDGLYDIAGKPHATVRPTPLNQEPKPGLFSDLR